MCVSTAVSELRESNQNKKEKKEKEKKKKNSEIGMYFTHFVIRGTF